MKSINVKELYKLIPKQSNSKILCIDVRSPGEYKSINISGTKNIPIDKLENEANTLKGYDQIYVNCGSGMRSSKACKKLKALGLTNIINVEGGIKACKEYNLNLKETAGVIPIIRQVHIVAGSLILIGSLLTWFSSNYFILIPGTVGLGLSYAGLSGNCLMGILLSKMPWNQ